MFSLVSNSTRIVAGLLLGLFAFILAEKNIHRHEQAELIRVQQEKPCVQPTSTCLICDFQMAADAEIPGLDISAAVTPLSKDPIAETFIALPLLVSLYCPDRGPPAFFIPG